MRRLLILFLCFAVLLGGCSEAKSLDTKDEKQSKNILVSAVNEEDDKGVIVYGRYGKNKEICTVNSFGREYDELYRGDYDKVTGCGDKIVIYSSQDDKWGIYLFDAVSKKLDLITEGFRLVNKPAFSEDGNRIAFYAYNKNDSKPFTPRVYYMDFKSNQPVKITKIQDEVKHISFMDNETIVYSKKLKKNGKELYQVFKYSIRDEVETRIMESASNDVNPVISPDGKRMAFLSDRYKNYNLFVLNLVDGSIMELDLNDAVVGESLVWSGDNTNIAYVALKGVAKYSVKTANIIEKSAITVDDGYIVAFSPGGKAIIYASYLIDEEKGIKKQIIYKRNVKDNKSEKLWEFPEESIYSRSINMLYWTDKLDV